jgi:hypothetical protein
MARRRRLAHVSPQNRIRPERRSGSVSSRMAVSRIFSGAGSSLSFGFTDSRMSDPAA